jgi:PPOX class probable F420-dependent enzyme
LLLRLSDEERHAEDRVMNVPTSVTRDGFPVSLTLPEPVRRALLADDAGDVRDHLAHDVVGWLTTVSPDGRPQTAVISFLWDGEGILFYSRPDTPKIRNMTAHPDVTFHLNCDPYGDHVVVVEGLAGRAPHEARSDVNVAYLRKYLEPYEHWGMDATATADEFSVPIRIIPERIRYW